MATGEKIGRVPLVCAALVVMVFGWMFADGPVDTGKRISGKVVQCENRRRSCVVQLDESGPLIVMAMPQGTVGQSVVVGVSRRRLTGHPWYWQAHEGRLASGTVGRMS